MVKLLAIAAGGALGALMRFGMASGVNSWLGKGFPYGTLIVNVSGCLLMGILYSLMLERLAVSPEVRAAILVGVLGAFTTFSTFSIETMELMQSREWLKAGLNVTLSVVLCLFATWIGILIARSA